MADAQAAGTLEKREDAGKGESGVVKLWLQALSLAGKEEEQWRARVVKTANRYRDERAEDHRGSIKFNILFSTTETLVPSLYNSTPIPDVRRRYGDEDPVGKVAAQVIDRALRQSIDNYDFDDVVASAVHNSELRGRGVAEVIYKPIMDPEDAEGAPPFEEVRCALTNWDDVRFGPARRWQNVPWIGFRSRITRQQAVRLNPKIGAEVKLDWVQDGLEKEKDPPDIFKRLTVWKIWDKEKREIVFIAPSWKTEPLKVERDLLGLRDFYPIPRPLYDITDPDSMVPQVPYEKYRDQAMELENVTQRIDALVKVMKWCGVRDAEIKEFDKLEHADDGQLIPSESVSAWVNKPGGLDGAIWLWPIERLITVIRELQAQREAIKQTIFEITGVADIMRGQTDPNETLGAQRIKAQWGTLRLQKRQREVQRFARDLLRLKAEIMVEKFEPQTLSIMTGIDLPETKEQAAAIAEANDLPEPPPDWESVMELLRNDPARRFRVDIETDSTIQADLSHAQENMSKFVEGLAAFLNAVAPAVEQGAMPLDIAVDLLTAFARQFKLGKQAEDALERMSKQAQEKAQQPQQAEQQGPDPAMAEVERKAGRDQQELQIKGQVAEAEVGLKREAAAGEIQIKRENNAAEVGLKREQAQGEAQAQQADTSASEALLQAVTALVEASTRQTSAIESAVSLLTGATVQ